MALSDVIENELHSLKKLRQRADFHPEIFVWDHEAMVSHSLRQWTEDGSREQRELMLVAAFHDIGKIPTTDRKAEDKGGYITSYGHAKKSKVYWDAVAPAFEDMDVRIDVIGWLIKEHMNLKFSDRMNENKLHNKKKEAENLGDRVWTMGQLFKKADDMIAFFERNNMDYHENAEASDDHLEPLERHEEAIGRFEDLVDDIVETISNWEEPYDNKELIFLRGVPGSGKTTVADMMTGPHGEVFETDEFFYDENDTYNFDASKLGEAHEWCRNQVEDAMTGEGPMNGGTSPVIVSNTSSQMWEMIDYFRMAAENGYRVHTIITENRHNSDSVHGVPDSACNKMRNRFEIRL